MYFPVPLAHLALVTAPVTRAWLGSIPAPHRSSVGEQLPGPLATWLLASFVLGWRWPPVDQARFYIPRKTSESRGRTFIPLRGSASFTRPSARCQSGQTRDESINAAPSTLTARIYSVLVFLHILHITGLRSKLYSLQPLHKLQCTESETGTSSPPRARVQTR